MNIRNIYTFLQVASSENITKTGEILGYSQSTVSVQISQLEEELGVKLFDRIGKKIVLTQYGENLVPYAQNVVTAVEALSNFKVAESELAGTIHVGFIQSLFDTTFQKIIMSYQERFPQVKVSVTVESTANLEKMLAKNEVDFACLIDSALENTKLHEYYSKHAKVAIVTGNSNPLASKVVLDPEDFRNQKYIFMEDDAPYKVEFQKALAGSHVEVEPNLYIQSCSMARKICEKSDYITVIPRYSADKSLKEGKCAELKLRDHEFFQEVKIIHMQQKFITPQIAGFMEEAAKGFDSILS